MSQLCYGTQLGSRRPRDILSRSPVLGILFTELAWALKSQYNACLRSPLNIRPDPVLRPVILVSKLRPLLNCGHNYTVPKGDRITRICAILKNLPVFEGRTRAMRMSSGAFFRNTCLSSTTNHLLVTITLGHVAWLSLVSRL